MDRTPPNLVSSPGTMRPRLSLSKTHFLGSDLINDDASEIKLRQIERVAEALQSNITTSPSTPQEKRLSIPLTNLSNKNLADHYTECIRLSTENKINTKNAFSLHLIDYMSEMFNNKDATDFQLASSTIDASAKIYSCRVDALHSEVYKLLTGLGRGWDKNEVAEEDNEDAASGELEDEPRKVPGENKTRKPKVGKTIVSNIKALAVNKSEQLNSLDPVLAKTINDFNIGSLGGLLLNKIRMHSDLAQLVIEPVAIADIRNRYVKPKEGVTIEVPEFYSMDLQGKKICKTFDGLSFLDFSKELDKPLTNAADDLHFNLEVEYDEPDAMRDAQGADGGFNDDGFATIAMSDDEADVQTNGGIFGNSSIQAQSMENTIASIKNGTMASLLQAINPNQSEYSYFKTDFLCMWAGPAHWKLKPRKDQNATKGSTNIKRIKKIEFKNDFSTMDEEIEGKMMVTKAATTVTKGTLMKHSDKKNLLPEDSKFDPQDLTRLFLLAKIVIGNQSIGEVADIDVDNYDYENKADQLDYCPPAQSDLNMENDNLEDNDCYYDALDFNLTASTTVQLGLDENNDGQAGFAPLDTIFEREGELLEGDNLIAPPRKIARVDIDYARVAKRIDVKLLKHFMWQVIDENIGQLVTTPIRPDNTTSPSTKVTLNQLIDQLKPKLPSPTKENLSIHIAFVCLLHIANEKNLQLTNMSDCSDILIEGS